MNLQSSAENPLNLVFTYNQDPFVEAINPSTGPTVGQTSVTLVGRGFEASAKCFFGTTESLSVLVISSTTLVCESPQM